MAQRQQTDQNTTTRTRLERPSHTDIKKAIEIVHSYLRNTFTLTDRHVSEGATSQISRSDLQFCRRTCLELVRGLESITRSRRVDVTDAQGNPIQVTSSQGPVMITDGFHKFISEGNFGNGLAYLYKMLHGLLAARMPSANVAAALNAFVNINGKLDSQNGYAEIEAWCTNNLNTDLDSIVAYARQHGFLECTIEHADPAYLFSDFIRYRAIGIGSAISLIHIYFAVNDLATSGNNRRRLDDFALKCFTMNKGIVIDGEKYHDTRPGHSNDYNSIEHVNNHSSKLAQGVTPVPPGYISKTQGGVTTTVKLYVSERDDSHLVATQGVGLDTRAVMTLASALTISSSHLVKSDNQHLRQLAEFAVGGVDQINATTQMLRLVSSAGTSARDAVAPRSPRRAVTVQAAALP